MSRFGGASAAATARAGAVRADTGGVTYRLVRSQLAPAVTVELDPAQRSVVDLVSRPGHGPLLVLAGPGTGKTTTLVEAVAARVAAGADPDRILTLTFSRKAAQELRDRVAARLGRTVAAQSAWTFHAFCYALVGQTRAPEDAGRPLRLLSGPEQDVMVRELVAGDLVEDIVAWPAELGAALRTRGFADELRTLLARARSLGLEPEQLRHAATAAGGRVDWAAAADFLDEYLDVLDAQGLVDYSELVHRAVGWAESDSGRESLRSRYDLVVVDEYQDTDPAQERLLRAIAGDGRDLLVVGDPDQSIYAFRGADVRALLEFTDRFQGRGGSRARVRTLRTSRRAGPTLLTASRAVAGRLPLAGAGLRDELRRHRALEAAAPVDGQGSSPDPGVDPGSDQGSDEGIVEVLTYPSAGLQVEAVADLLRRAHLDDGLPWTEMAVLVRSAARSIPTLRRALGAAGVPVEVSGDELPLAREPAVRPLLDALAVASGSRPLSAELAHSLLLSPLAGAEPAQLRRLGRALRERQRVATATPSQPAGALPSPSAELVRAAVTDPAGLDGLDDRLAGPVRRLATLLAAAREVVDGGGTAHAALWSLWSATPWPARLQRAAARGGSAGRAADRDLDAVVALFDAAARDADRDQRRPVAAFTAEIEAQQIPADTLAERGTRHAGVRVLTAHRSKGLEWDLVVVVDVQEDVWPDLRRRGSLLEADRLAVDGVRPPETTGDRLAEERRLFYVAITRARRRLVVTAVESAEDDGLRASRFVSEVGVDVQHRADRPRRPLTLPALVAELRSVSSDPSLPDAARLAAARRLAALAAAETDDGRRLVPASDPDRWWGVLEPTDPGRPTRDPEAPIALSGSSLVALRDCALRWFLEHEIGARRGASGAQGFGSVVHAVAHDVARGGTAPDLESLGGLLDSVWDQLHFDAPWQRRRERAQAQEVLERFLVWHQGRDRVVVGSEVEFVEEREVAGRTLRLRGSIDRVEVDVDGRVHVVDLKTGKTPPTAAEVATHPQLGVYQLAAAGEHVRALDGVRPEAEPGGAELVYLRSGRGRPTVLAQDPLGEEGDGPRWIDGLLELAVTQVDTEHYPPTRGRGCASCDFLTLCPAQDSGRQVIE